MNAIWLTHIAAYQKTENSFISAEKIMNLKNQRREVLLKKHGIIMPHFRLANCGNAQKIMLTEGRAAKEFWKRFAGTLPSWCNFRKRYPGSSDIVNRLLDVGYHHITGLLKSILKKYDISTALGILHVARKSTSDPLAYDLVEMFRADTAEAEVLRFLRMKKRPQEKLSQKDIALFLNRLNRRISRKYFIKSFRQCQTYRYYMELQVLKFISTVNQKGIFSPLYLPSRHDVRCTKGICSHPKNIDNSIAHMIRYD